MNNLAEISFNLVNNFLKIRKNDFIAISGKIYNYGVSEDPLEEISFIEELNIAFRKKEASTDIRIATDKMHYRTNNELLSQQNEFPKDYHQNWINGITTLVDVSWHSLARDLANEMKDQDNQISENDKIWQLALKNQKKLIFMNYPTHQLATKLNTKFEELKRAYLKMINCNYPLLKIYAEEMREEFYSFANYTIKTAGEEIDLKILKNEYQLYMGFPNDHNITVLPAGVIEFPMDRTSLNGTFFAENVYYRNLIYHDVKINFIDGIIRYVTFKIQKKGNYLLQNTVMSSQPECFFSLGFNNEHKSYTGFYLYDRCLQGNIILKLFDQNSYPVIFANLNAEIKKRK